MTLQNVLLYKDGRDNHNVLEIILKWNLQNHHQKVQVRKNIFYSKRKISIISLAVTSIEVPVSSDEIIQPN